MYLYSQRCDVGLAQEGQVHKLLHTKFVENVELRCPHDCLLLLQGLHLSDDNQRTTLVLPHHHFTPYRVHSTILVPAMSNINLALGPKTHNEKRVVPRFSGLRNSLIWRTDSVHDCIIDKLFHCSCIYTK